MSVSSLIVKKMNSSVHLYIQIIIEKHGRIILYCKGADTMIKERLDPSENEIIEITDRYLHVRMEIIRMDWRMLEMF